MGNCDLQCLLSKDTHYAHDLLLHTFNIGMFKYNSTAIEHIYSESVILNESYDIVFDTNDWLNLT